MINSIRQILDECSDEEAKSWWEDIQNSRWPATMPIPLEAHSDVWHQLQKRVISIKPKDKKNA